MALRYDIEAIELYNGSTSGHFSLPKGMRFQSIAHSGHWISPITQRFTVKVGWTCTDERASNVQSEDRVPDFARSTRIGDLGFIGNFHLQGVHVTAIRAGSCLAHRYSKDVLSNKIVELLKTFENF